MLEQVLAGFPAPAKPFSFFSIVAVAVHQAALYQKNCLWLYGCQGTSQLIHTLAWILQSVLWSKIL